jgi:hypothetical protein
MTGMTCTLRAIGRDLDVEAFLETSCLRGEGVYRRDTPRLDGEPGGPLRSASGFSVSVAVGVDDDEALMQEVVMFLADNEAELRRLGSFEGVEEVCLEVVIPCQGPGMSVTVFPADLLWRAGALDIDLVVTHSAGRAGVH